MTNPYGDAYDHYDLIRDKVREIIRNSPRGTQRRIAQDLDRHQSIIADCLNGKGRPRPDVLHEIALWVEEHKNDPAYQTQ